MSDLFKLSLEAIAFQVNNQLFPTLTACFDRAIAAFPDTSTLQAEMETVRKLTMTATGINMNYYITDPKMSIETPYMVEVLMSTPVALNVFDMATVKKLRKYDLENIDIYETIKGKVDLKNGRVSGAFSDVEHTFRTHLANFNGYFTGAEMAALYLHEVGHVFTMYYYLCETMITNTILAEIVGRIDQEDNFERKLILGKAALKLSGGNPADMTPESTGAEISVVVMENQPRRMQQNTGSRWYDQRLAEALSDQFAARWMAAAPLVVALAKSERSKNFYFASTGFDPIWVGLSSNFLTFALLPFSSVKAFDAAIGEVVTKMVVDVAAKGILARVAKSFSISFALGTLGYITSGHKRYDAPKVRFLALRRELVTLLKNRALEAPVRAQAIADIATIDAEIDNIHNYGDLMGKLTKWIRNSLLGRRQEQQAHHTKEELANNRFYELAAIFQDK